MDVNNVFYVGYYGDGTCSISAGLLDVDYILVAPSSGDGDMTISGTADVDVANYLNVGSSGAGTGSLSISDGTLDVDDMTVAPTGTGTFTISDSNAAITVADDFTLGADANFVVTDANSVITLSGVGSDFVIDGSTTTTNVAGLQNLHLLFDANDSGGGGQDHRMRWCVLLRLPDAKRLRCR